MSAPDGIDPALHDALRQLRPSFLVVVAIDEDGTLRVDSVAGRDVPARFEGTRLVLELAALGAPEDGR